MANEQPTESPDSQPEKPPWYSEGLRFECTACGDCCSGPPGFVWVEQKEIAALAEHLGMAVDEFEGRYVRQVGPDKSLIEYPDGDCIFLDRQSRKCSVYAARPTQCRTWPFWDSNLATRKDWKWVCEVCPGSGRGQLYSFEEIEIRRKSRPV
jgi:Fe-S-cluster containining protein